MQLDWVWKRLAVLTALVLVSAACGGGGAADTTTTSGSVSPTTREASETSTSASPTTTIDPGTTTTSQDVTTTKAATTTTTRPAGADLGVREEPPGGVPAEFEEFVGGDGEPDACDFDPLLASPYVASSRFLEFDHVGYSIGLTVRFCIHGFDPSAPMEFRLETPDGDLRQWELVLGGGPGRGIDLLTAASITSNDAERDHFATYWSLYPHTPYGIYTVRGHQGAIDVFSAIEVTPPFEVILRRLDHAGDLSSTSGGSAQFGLYGYPPNTDVPLYVYTRSGDFVASLGSIEVSDRGEALYELVVDSGPPAEYCVVTDHQLDQIAQASEVGFEYLADPCWSGASGFSLS